MAGLLGALRRFREFARNYIPINRFEVELRVREEVEAEVAQWHQEISQQVAALSEHLMAIEEYLTEFDRRLPPDGTRQ